MRFLACGPAAAAALLISAGCSQTFQTTSGADYIARAEAAGAILEDDIRHAAAVEPLLTFPARIGIARIENGSLTDIPEEELESWQSALANVNGGDEFTPVSLFITELVTPRAAAFAPDAGERTMRRRSIIDRLRLGGARQHFDAILVYEVFAKSDRSASDWSIANLTIIGGFIAPGSKVDAQGHASALLFDVRNGYPYGTASATVSRDALSPTFRSFDREEKLKTASQTAAVAKLSLDVAEMMSKLETKLSAR